MTLVCTPGLLRAQDEVQRVTLDRALTLFRSNNPELYLSRLDVLEAEGRATQASALYDPVAEVTWEPLFGGSGMQTELTVALSQRILWPGLRGARREAAAALVDVSRRRAELDSVQGVAGLIRIYVDAAAATERIAQFGLLIDVFRQAEGWAQNRVHEGESAGYSLRRLRLEHAMLENRMMEEEIELQRLQRALAFLVYPDGTPGLVTPATGIDSVADIPSLDTLYLIAEANRTEIALARSRIAAEQSTLALIRAELSPAPTVSLGYTHKSDGLNGPVIGLALPLPIFDRRAGDIDAVEARIRAAETRLDVAERSVQTDVEQTYETYRAIAARVDHLIPTFEADATVMLGAAQIGYREGEMSLTELLNAVETYREVRILMIDLYTRRQIAYFDLMRAAGRILPATREDTR